MTPLVLVHGGGFDSRCWDPLVRSLTAPVVTVDLPGRGRRPARLESVTFADCARAIVEDVDAAGFDEVVLVAHSLGGCSLPRAMALLGNRVSHAVFVAAMVPEDGTGTLHELRPGVRSHVETATAERRPTMDPARAKRYFGNDLDEEQFAWCHDQPASRAGQHPPARRRRLRAGHWRLGGTQASKARATAGLDVNAFVDASGAPAAVMAGIKAVRPADPGSLKSIVRPS